MMSKSNNPWRVPGKPFIVHVAGIDIECRPMTEERRIEIIQTLEQVPADTPRKLVSLLRDVLTEEIVKFHSPELADCSVADVVSSQTGQMIANIWSVILAGSQLSETESGN